MQTSKGRKKTLLIVLLIVAVLVAGLFVGAWLYLRGLGEPFDAQAASDTVMLTIEPGTVTSQIGQLLQDNGIIEDGREFRLWSRIHSYDSSYQAGTYAFSPAMSFDDIAQKLAGGEVETFTFTIPEGYTIGQTVDALVEAGLGDADVFWSLLTGGGFDEEFTFLQDAQTGENHLEGYLLPNTYTLAVGSDEEDILRVMLQQFETSALQLYEGAEADRDMSLNDYIIAASIIEREAMLDEERALVSSVIYNRLAIDMPLQMCSTVQYVLGEPKALLTDADTQTESPYNTYLHGGLPPGPICSPGLASIEAAMHPADTDYLYFVLSEKLDGSSNFSRDYDEFLRNKDAYYEAYAAAH